MGSGSGDEGAGVVDSGDRTLLVSGCGVLLCCGTGEQPVDDALDDGRLCLGDRLFGLLGDITSQRIGEGGSE